MQYKSSIVQQSTLYLSHSLFKNHQEYNCIGYQYQHPPDKYTILLVHFGCVMYTLIDLGIGTLHAAAISIFCAF
jgi:hypothetical protein